MNLTELARATATEASAWGLVQQAWADLRASKSERERLDRMADAERVKEREAACRLAFALTALKQQAQKAATLESNGAPQSPAVTA